MKKFFKRLITVTILTMGLIIPAVLGAAGKPSLNKKSAEITVGKTVKLKAKNINKKAKIKWKSGKKSVAKIAKKASKGRVAYVKGVKAGKAVIKMTYTIGKKSKVLKCKVTVVEETANGADSGSQTGNNNNGSSSNNNGQGNTSNPTATPGTTPSGGDNVTPTTEPANPTAAPTNSPDDPNPTESPDTPPTATPAPEDEGKLTDHDANGSEAEIPFDDIFGKN